MTKRRDNMAYNLKPETTIKNYSDTWEGYESIFKQLRKNSTDNTEQRIVIECYPGVDLDEIEDALRKECHDYLLIRSDDYAYDAETVTEMIQKTLTEDRVFGVMSHAELTEFFPSYEREKLQKKIANTKQPVIVYGTGASLLVEEPTTLVYADLTRWEIQLRFRKGMPNWRGANEEEDALRKFKRGYFFEWRMADRLKQKLYNDIDFLLDTNKKNEPKMVSGKDYRQALSEVVSQPFRLVPYFDASVWGGQWMKEQFNLDPSAENYGWAFDGVPEENSLLLRFGATVIEIPAINAVHQFPDELLGKKVRARFGKEFPIRFDYLDTVGGGNLSLQVHPMVEYIQEKFGMHYTQNESYYILDANERSTIYLGVKEGISKNELFADLKKAATGDFRFPDEKYINCFPVKKHDHYSIPSGTIHCGGPETVVLEISQTPYIFTFKLWDWERVGLDGIPRPVHLKHGEKNVQIDYDTNWVKENLINQIEVIEETDNSIIEKTGLNELELIETRRYWFSDMVEVKTKESVNMLNLVEGEKITVESLTGAFEPFNVNYGETFIVPEQLKEYKLVNQGDPTKKVAVIQAFIRGL